MVVCFSIGKSSKGVISNISTALDNIDFHSFDTIEDIVREAKLRHLNFKRIIISNTIIKNTEEELNLLNDFIKNYSSSTEVVIVINSNLPNAVDVMEYFCRVFNSPMYTVAEVGKATTRTLAELLTSEILYIQETYFPSKKEVFNNLGKSSELTSSGEIVENTTSSTGETLINNSKEDVDENISIGSTNSIEGSLNNKNEVNGTPINSNFNSFSPVRVGMGEELEDIFSDMGDDLSLGSFGSSHSDTGFLDDDDEEDLKEFIKSREESKPDVVVKDNNAMLPVKEVSSANNTVVNINPPMQSSNSPAKSKVDIILSLRNSSVHKDLVNEANRIAKEDGVKVLIINADYRESVLLSYLNLEYYYSNGYTFSIQSLSPVNVDSIYVLSNGYGMGISEGEIDLVLNSTLYNQFDMIYVYCPLDCISILSDACLYNNNIILNPGKDLVDYISTTKLLTSRYNLSLVQERIIMSSCLLDIESYRQEDFNKLSSMCLFANGSWLDRLGL